MIDKYILDDNGIAQPEPDLMKWGDWLQTADRHVGLYDGDGVRVSTVFLGLDHSFGDGAPILFETMIFGGKYDGAQERYCTRTEALLGHERHVEMVRRQ